MEGTETGSVVGVFKRSFYLIQTLASFSTLLPFVFIYLVNIARVRERERERERKGDEKNPVVDSNFRVGNLKPAFNLPLTQPALHFDQS